MDARTFECRECGYQGSPEDVIGGFSVCPECGAMAASRPSPPGGTAPFDRPVYRYRFRLYGPIARVLQRLKTPAIHDAADREIARVTARRPSLRRFVALFAGAVLLTGMILLSMWLLEPLPPDGWLVRLAMYAMVPPMLLLSLGTVAWLSPGPDVLVTGAGLDPRLLLRVRPVDESGFTSVLEVEDTEGISLGTLRLNRVRDLLFPLGHRAPLIEIEPKRGPRLRVRRPSAFMPGWVFETEDGAAVATYALNPGLLTRDELDIVEPPPCDRRLLVAAMLVARP